MTATGHALVGALIAGKFADPILVATLAYLSHFPCDVLPHWDAGTHHEKKKTKRIFYEAAADVLISYIASFIVFWFVLNQRDLLLLFIAVFSAHLPDWISFPYFLWKIKFPPSIIMQRFQERLNNRLDKPWGIITQVVAVATLYIVLYIIF